MQDPISNQRLALVLPEVRRRVEAADAALAKTGRAIRVAEGLRTYAESDADFAKGRTVLHKPDGSHQGIVTNARGGYSWHNFGLAVDCYPFLHGSTGDLDWNAGDPEFHAMVAALEAEGLAWGGEWHDIKDPPHFQLREIPVSPTQTDRNAFGKGDLARVWLNYAHLGGSLGPVSASMDPDFVRSFLLVLIDPYFWRSFVAHARTVVDRFRRHRRPQPDHEYAWVVLQYRPGRGSTYSFDQQGVFSTRQLAVNACRTDKYCVLRMVVDEELPEERMDDFVLCWYPTFQPEPEGIDL